MHTERDTVGSLYRAKPDMKFPGGQNTGTRQSREKE